MYKNAGFTLIELLVVVLIIGILSAVALPQYEKAVMKTRLSRFLPLMRAVDEAQQVYFLANGAYSKNLHDLDISLPAGAVTEANTRFVYQDFECFLGAENLVSLYCRDLKYEWPRLEKYFSSTHTICWDGDDSRGKAVCQSLGKRCGRSTSSLGDCYCF